MQESGHRAGSADGMHGRGHRAGSADGKQSGHRAGIADGKQSCHRAGRLFCPPPFSPFSPGLCQEWWSLPPSIGSGPAARCVWCLGSARSVGVALQLLPLRGKEVWHRKTGGAPRAPPRLSRACAPGRGLGFCPLSVRQARSRFGVVTTTPRTASAAPPIGKSLY